MSQAEEPGIGCFHCDYLGWRTRDVRVSRPDDAGCITEACPYCSSPEEPEWTPGDDDWGMADDLDRDEPFVELVLWFSPYEGKEERIG